MHRLAMLLLILSISAMAQSGTYSNIVQYPINSSGLLEEITAGPDGSLWFADDAGKIDRITTSGAITEYTLATLNSQPFGVTVGPDEAIWFTELAGKIGRISKAGVIDEINIPGSVPFGITSGPDGALWFADFGGNKIGRYTLAGALTEFALPNPDSEPYEITLGRDGALWFTEFNGSRIGRITTTGAINEYPVSSQTWGIASGSDGALWFTEANAGKIGRITTAGVVTEYNTPTASSTPTGISSGPDGAIWFTEYTALKIGRITNGGVITEYPVSAAEPWRITAGPDGGLWYTGNAPLIGRAPACGLGFSASFAGNALTMNFNLGIDTPATFSINLHDASGPFGQPFSRNIRAVVPPQPFTMVWNSFPNRGAVTVESVLATQPGGPGLGLCSEWTTVNTGQ
jgi:streptogramin lyase